MITLTITPEADPSGDVYLRVAHDDLIDYCVGPLRNGEPCVAVLAPTEQVASGPPGKRVRDVSRKQEARIAESLGGRVQPGSGSSSRAKGDVRKVGEWRGEAKFTFSQRYALTLDVLRKILSECADGERPALFLDFVNRATGQSRDRYVVLHETDFEELLKHAPAHDR